ncbi:hypothetical protein ACC718_17955 [Rhizobium ruizarguesonis]
MNPDKLRNLLQSIDIRLARAEKDIIALDGRSGPASNVVQELAVLRSEVRRQLSKVDTLKGSDVSIIEQKMEFLRSVASNRFSAFGSNTPITEPLRAIMDDSIGLANLVAGIRIGLNQLGPDDVLETLPGQKTAAFQFDFEGDNLRVVDQPLRPSFRERDMALAALEAAVDNGEYVNQDLAATNASPRLKETFERLQATMVSHKNIVQIGARAQICNRIVHGNIEELSPTLFGLLIGHIESVFSALAQFEDWRIYSENAAALNIDAGSVAKLVEGTGQLVKQLQKAQSGDKSVVDALETVKGWVEDVDPPDKRDVLSLTSSHENLWSIVAKSVLGIGRDMISDGRKRIASAILTALLLSAPLIVPVIGKVAPGAQWIETVYDYFKAAGSKLPGVE